MSIQTFSGGPFHVGMGLCRDEGVTWEDLSMEEFFMREENVHKVGAGFSRII